MNNAARLVFATLALYSAFLSAPGFAEFRYRIAQDYGTLDWGYGEVNPSVVLQLMEGLTLSGTNGEPLPGIAFRWTETRSGYVFVLRPEATWSDGKRVCAQDFVDAWVRVLSPQFASPYAHYLFDVVGAKNFHAGRAKDASSVGVRAEGCNRLIVTTERPAPFFPALTSHWVLFPVRLDLISKHGRSWARPPNLVVTGPYLLERWEPDRELWLKRNDRYYGRKPFEERLRAVVVADDATAVSLFQKKRLDWVKDLPFLDKEKLAKRSDFRIFPSFVEYHLGFRFASPALSRDQRCALSRALNKDEIPMVLKGKEEPAWTIVPAGLKAASRRYASFDPVAAKKLWKNFQTPVEVHFYSKDIHIPLMEWIQGQWQTHLGAKVTLKRLESKSYWAQLSGRPPLVFLSGITAAYAHPFSFLSEFLSQSPANWGTFASDQYDQAASRGQTDVAEKILLEEECAVIPLYFRSTSSLISETWDGFHINPLTYVYLSAVHRKP